MLAPFWTDAKTDEAKRLWLSGMSSREIGEEIGASRNSVIGKINRMGLGEEKREVRPSNAKRPRSVRIEAHHVGALAYKVTRAIRARQLHDSAPDVTLPKTELCEGFRHLTLIDLDETTCKWPHGSGPVYSFCGLTPHEGFPYCTHHSRIAYQPPGTRDKSMVPASMRDMNAARL